MRPLFAAIAVAALTLGGLPAISPEPALAQAECDPLYPDFCIPLVEGDVFNCLNDPVILDRKNFRAFEPDPHRLDQGGEPGVACEDDSQPLYPTPVGPVGPTATPTRSSNTLPMTSTPTPRGTWTALPATATATRTATTAPPTATPTTPPPTATSAPATPTRTNLVPLPPNTGTGGPSPSNSTASLAILAAIGTLIALAGALATTRKR